MSEPVPPSPTPIPGPASDSSSRATKIVGDPTIFRPQAVRRRGAISSSEKVLKALNRRRARGSAAGTSSYAMTNDTVMSGTKHFILTGIPTFDQITGGFPFGKVVELYGLDACGKTALSMLAAGQASFGSIYETQDDGSLKKLDVPYEVTVLYLDNENSLEDGTRMKVYDRIVNIIGGECDTIDTIFKDLETCAEQVAYVIKSDQAKAKSDPTYVVPLQFLVVVVDTIAGTSTRQALSQDWAKQDYARQPIQLREGFRNTIRRLKEQNICLICTNQVGDSFKMAMKKMPGALPSESDFNSFGGKALRYYGHLRVFMQKLPNPYKLAPGRYPDGFVVQFYVAKNRVKMPYRSGRMALLFENALCHDVEYWRKHVRPKILEEVVETEKAAGRDTSMEAIEKLVGNSPAGGYSPAYSILEHLIFSKKAVVTGTKSIKIKVPDGVEVSAGVEVDNEDELEVAGAVKGKWIEIPNRLSWPNFYRSNKELCDAIFDDCITEMFSQNGKMGSEDVMLTDLDELSEEGDD